jgi:GLPGLI family protein
MKHKLHRTPLSAFVLSCFRAFAPSAFCFLLFSSANLCFCQENGVVTYTVSHDWSKKVATCEYLSKAERDRSSYVWGGRTYDQKAELKFNAHEYRFEYKEDDEKSTYQWRKEDYIIYRDREKGETFDVFSLLDKEYVIKDSLECQQWKIKNDIKEVAGRICMNASYYDTLKKKEVIAWFALDLPIPIGPNRYCGLPGMILEINEADGAVVYTATSILFSDEEVKIDKPIIKKNRKNITYEEYNKKIAEYIAECKKMQRPYFWSIAF